MIRRRDALALLAAAIGAGALLPGGCDKTCSDTHASKPGAVRVVSLSPAVSVILRDLGHADSVVGRSSFELALDPALANCGDQTAIDYEAIVRLKPTHVFTQWGARDLPPRLVELSKTHHWTLRDFRLLSLDDIPRAIRDIDGVYSPEVPSPAARDLSRRMAHAWSKGATDLARAGRVLLLADLSPPGALGPGSFHHDILVRIGGTPALTQGSAYVSVDKEDVLRMAPDAIVVVIPRPPRSPAPKSTPAARDLLGPFRDLDIPAVARGRVALIDDPLCHTPSSAMIEFADQLATILSGWGETTPGASPGSLQGPR